MGAGGSIVQIEFDLANRGAKLQALSQYPAEVELLFPPVTALTVEEKKQVGPKRVLHVRAAHLRRGGRREDKPAFAAAAREVEVSEEQVRAKIAREREREKTLPAREETARAGTKDRNRAASKAKPNAAKAPAGARTGSTRR